MVKKILVIVIFFINAVCFSTNGQNNIEHEPGKWTAIYYGNTYKGQRRTANGDKFNMNAMTCAAPKKYKFGTWLKIENLNNNKSVIVKVTDRGAFGEQTIDLTYGAFSEIANHREGRIKIKVYNLGKDYDPSESDPKETT